MKECKNCLYFKELDSGRSGNCHRYPPVCKIIPVKDALGQEGLRLVCNVPNVVDDHFCGEWKMIDI